MDDDYPSRTPNMVKLESELIRDSDITTGFPFTVSYQEASDHDPSETFVEQTLAFPVKVEVSLPSIPKPGSSPWKDVTIKIKEEPAEDVIPSPESAMDNSQHFPPALQKTSILPEELISVKVEGDIAEESDSTEENRRHLYFTEGDAEMGVDDLQCRKMSFTSCSEDERFESFGFSAFGAKKTVDKADNEDLLTDESVFLHSEHFPRLSNCKFDSENGSVIDSPSVSSMSADDTRKYKRKSTAQNYTESACSEETSSEMCSLVSRPRLDFSSSDPILSEERPFSCKQCPARFKRKGDFQSHLVIHSNEKPFACTQCSARFKRKSELQSHIMIHSNEKPFPCDQCSIRCKRKRDLQKHLLIHSGEKPFPCDQCSARFTEKGNLNKHMLKHSSEKAFTCNHCSAQFKRKDTLKCHLLTHSNEKAFTCDQCSAQFNRVEHLNRHLLIHSNKRAFTCNRCSAQFKRKETLTYHLLTHSNEKAFTCDQCSAQFNTKHYFKMHLLNHSSNK